MLVFIVAVAILGSFAIEFAVRLFANNFEIEWVTPAEESGADIARNIIGTMRKTRLESERQMNKPFKVASDGRW